MRGYFAIGVEEPSKAMNVGSLFRSAHAFGAAFVFAIRPSYKAREARRSDTSDLAGALPFYNFPELADFRLPQGCKLVGVELTEDAVELPSFRHPQAAAYVLGRERGELTQEMLARCDHVIKIPTRFCLNLAIAGTLVMYDRLLSLGRFAERPLMPGADPLPRKPHVRGAQILRKAGMDEFLDSPDFEIAKSLAQEER